MQSSNFQGCLMSHIARWQHGYLFRFKAAYTADPGIGPWVFMPLSVNAVTSLRGSPRSLQPTSPTVSNSKSFGTDGQHLF